MSTLEQEAETETETETETDVEFDQEGAVGAARALEESYGEERARRVDEDLEDAEVLLETVEGELADGSGET